MCYTVSMGYDRDLRIKAVQYCMNRNSIRQTASVFSVGHDTILRWKTEFNMTGDIKRKVQNREHLRKVTPEKIEVFLQANPNANQEEMALAFGCKSESVCVALKKFGYSKKLTKLYQESDPIKRERFLEYLTLVNLKTN